MYPPDQIILPDEPPDDTADIPPVALTTQAAGSFRPADRRQAIAAYAASTSYMDAQVGKVVGALDRLGITDPHEYRSLSSSAQHADTVRLLKELLRRVPALEIAKPPR